MRILPSWIADFVDLKVSDRELAEALTHAGIAVESVEEGFANAVYEMDITTNRVDAMNHYGVAREASAIYDRDLNSLLAELPGPTPAATAFPVEIQSPDLCARFTARVIRGAKIGPSSDKVAGRFVQLGQKSINSAADATNYVMQMMGQPTHAFDLDKIEGGRIIVRQARGGERLKTLDGVERVLDPDDLVVADAVKPVGLAGVMGGWDSMITESTSNVLVEAAWFDPAAIRRSSRRHGIHTDASHRFERGADWNAPPLASALVAELILLRGGALEGELVDVITRNLHRNPIPLRRGELLRILGQEIPEKDVLRILLRLGFKIEAARGESSAYLVEPPSWRLDVEREIDLIEEVARVYGFNNFQNRLPAFAGAVVQLPHAAKQEKTRCRLLGLGFNEAISSSFLSSKEASRFAGQSPVPLENPLSEEAAVLRTTLLPGMLNMLSYNVNRGTNSVRLFEIGNVFAATSDRVLDAVTQRPMLALGACGEEEPLSVHSTGRAFDFYDLKGHIEKLLHDFEGRVTYDTQVPEFLHPGRAARILMEGVEIGFLGQIHPSVAGERKIKPVVFTAELDLECLYARPPRSIQYRKISKFPAVDRDFSFVFGHDVMWQHIADAVGTLKIAEMQNFEPREIFRGSGVPEGKYAILMRVVFQSGERTLRDDEVQVWWLQVIKELEALGGSLRA